jgi:2-succinyl-5-enolpyruvyl-6-hydroxy-3-cyclohexene-1-carboxylate synthase
LRKKDEIRPVISDKLIVQHLVAFCKQKGIKNIVFSPGSRNAPLVISFTQDSFFNCKTIVDERSAAFIALGMSIELDEPVLICCTSGSAALNYAPAISEAHYQKVPLFVVTADRPQKWIDNGEGQSIQQINVFANYCKSSFHINDFDTPSLINETLKEVNKAIFYGYKGPVHLNLAFEEPLYQVLDTQTVEESSFIHLPIETEERVTFSSYLSKWQSYQRIMIICGQLKPNKSLLYALQNLMIDKRIVMLTENISNLQDVQFINSIDRTLERIPRAANYQPELVITLGDAIVSKKIKTFLRAIPNLEHWIVQVEATRVDVFGCLKEVISTNESAFFNFLSNDGFLATFQEANFQNIWRKEAYLADDLHNRFIQNAPWSDLKVFDILHQTLPLNVNLHLSNSSPIRYWQLFNCIDKVTHYSNRGVSGIDGSSSTALGVALTSSKMNLLITGDLSFVYDSNAFWNKYPKGNLKVIVINNGGGGIFRIIPGPGDSAVMDDFFEVGNTASIKDLCAAYGMHYYAASSEIELETALDCFYLPDDQAYVLEIFTPNKINPVVLNDYFNYIKNN